MILIINEKCSEEINGTSCRGEFHEVLEQGFVAVKVEDLNRWRKNAISQGRWDDKSIKQMMEDIKKYLSEENT